MKFEIEFPKIHVDPKWLETIDLPKTLGQEAETTRTRLISAFQSGHDANMGPLRRYSPGYAKKKAEETGSAIPNLTVSGQFARSLVSKPAKSLTDTTEIRFRGSHKGGIANAGLAAKLYGMGFVGWFQWGNDDLARIFKSVNALIDRKLKDLVDAKP